MSPLHIPGGGETLHVYSRDWSGYKLHISLVHGEARKKSGETNLGGT